MSPYAMHRLALVLLPFVAPAMAAEQQPIYLSPVQDINLPPSASASNPLTLLGAASPWFAGPNVNNIENTTPEGCVVEQVASVSRHGSRYPDTGAYSGWVALYDRIQAANFTATGELAFLKEWKPVLKNPAVEIAQQSPTGYKEAFDLGYRLRTRYPDLYTAGSPFISWANLYPRVVQTAQNFVRGFLGSTASSLGTVITVNATGSMDALFDSLGPSDLCPKFADGNGGTFAAQWDAIWLPPVVSRFNALLTGDLTLTAGDVSSFPYLCGFESQITGILSPFCSTFTDAELRLYEYRQDLRYFYGTGPGTDLPSKIMLPFLKALVGVLASGPGLNGTKADGESFALPNIITLFANDGQLTELVAGTGVFDDQAPLSGTEIPEDWRYKASHFVSMRGTVAFERLKCAAPPSESTVSSSSSSTLSTAASPTICLATPSTTAALQRCNRDNCLRQFLQSTAQVSSFCATYTTAVESASTALPSYVSQCGASPSRISSACSCVVSPPTPTVPCPVIPDSTSTSSATPTPTSSTDNTYIRILLNDAVYPVPSCRGGPGGSCPLSDYVDIVGAKLAAAGDLRERCEVVRPGGPAGADLKGASFLTDLRASYLASVVP